MIERLSWLNYDIRPGRDRVGKRSAHRSTKTLDVKVIVKMASVLSSRRTPSQVKSPSLTSLPTGVDRRKFDVFMEEFLRENPDIALRKINIIDWDSPVANQHLAHAENIPARHVFLTSRRPKRRS